MLLVVFLRENGSELGYYLDGDDKRRELGNN